MRRSSVAARAWSCTILADEKRKTYALAGTKVATAGELIGPKVVARSLVATAKTGKVQTQDRRAHGAARRHARDRARRARDVVAHRARRKRQRFARGDPRGGAGDRLTAEQAVVAPFAGTVIAIAHEPDEPVAPGTALVVLEAMKMEHEVIAQDGGVVRRVDVSVGDTVTEGQVLAIVEPGDHDGDGASAEDAAGRSRRATRRSQSGPRAPRDRARRGAARRGRKAPRARAPDRPREPRRPRRRGDVRRVRAVDLRRPGAATLQAGADRAHARRRAGRRRRGHRRTGRRS